MKIPFHVNYPDSARKISSSQKTITRPPIKDVVQKSLTAGTLALLATACQPSSNPSNDKGVAPLRTNTRATLSDNDANSILNVKKMLKQSNANLNQPQTLPSPAESPLPRLHLPTLRIPETTPDPVRDFFKVSPESNYQSEPDYPRQKTANPNRFNQKAGQNDKKTFNSLRKNIKFNNIDENAGSGIAKPLIPTEPEVLDQGTTWGKDGRPRRYPTSPSVFGPDILWEKDITPRRRHTPGPSAFGPDSLWRKDALPRRYPTSPSVFGPDILWEKDITPRRRHTPGPSAFGPDSLWKNDNQNPDDVQPGDFPQ